MAEKYPLCYYDNGISELKTTDTLASDIYTNADRILDIAVDNTNIGDGKVLAFNVSSNIIEYITPSDNINFYYAQRLNEVSTNATVYGGTNVFTYTTPSLVAGTYRIGVTFKYKVDAGGKIVETQFQVDDTDTLFTTSDKVNDVDDALFVTTFIYHSLTSGSHVLDLDYKINDPAKFVFISNAVIELWRVL